MTDALLVLRCNTTNHYVEVSTRSLLELGYLQYYRIYNINVISIFNFINSIVIVIHLLEILALYLTLVDLCQYWHLAIKKIKIFVVIFFSSLIWVTYFLLKLLLNVLHKQTTISIILNSCFMCSCGHLYHCQCLQRKEVGVLSERQYSWSCYKCTSNQGSRPADRPSSESSRSCSTSLAQVSQAVTFHNQCSPKYENSGIFYLPQYASKECYFFLWPTIRILKELSYCL